MNWFSEIKIFENKPNKYIILIVAIILLISANSFLRLNFPGISDADLRPQVVIIFLSGYFFGPLLGFIVGFLGNLVSDIFIGHQFQYLPSWTIGNGLMGLTAGLIGLRKILKIQDIKQFIKLIGIIILSNLIPVTYSAIMMDYTFENLTIYTNIQYFILPVLNSNIIISLILIPLIMLLFGKLKRNYPIKVSLTIYYTIAVVMSATWILSSTDTEIIEYISQNNLNSTDGNIIVEKFNKWALLFIGLLISGLVASVIISELITKPIQKLNNYLYDILSGNEIKPDFESISREDEIGMLSIAAGLINEKILSEQRLFVGSFIKKMKFVSSDDSNRDVFVVGLAGMIGKDILEIDFDRGGDIALIEAVSIAVNAAGLEELARTYSQENIDKALIGLGEFSELSFTQKQHLAIAIDLNLIFRSTLKVSNANSYINRNLVYHLLFNINKYLQNDKKHLGYITEPEISSKLINEFSSHKPDYNWQFDEKMTPLLSKKLITGFNVKNENLIANFEKSLTIRYTHNNLKHFKQLIGILKRENLQAGINLEPRYSTFIFLNFWIKDESINLKKTDKGFLLANTVEFDLALEFNSHDSLILFKQIVSDFAITEDNSTSPKLYQSWYKPLFLTNVPTVGFYQVNSFNIKEDIFRIEFFVTNENKENALLELSKIFDEEKIEISTIMVNDEFYKYITNQ